MKNANSSGFTVTAHTGCEGTRDNSLQSIEVGAAKGADIVEFDLRLDSQGKAVLSHDEAEDGSCVTVEEAFSLVSAYEGLMVNIDCKTTRDLVQVLQCAEEKGIADRIFYTGIEEKDVPDVLRQTPQVKYYINIDVNKDLSENEDYLLSLAQKVLSLGGVGINMHYEACSKKLVDIFREKGLQVSVWTVNDKEAMQWAVTLPADNITTRNVEQLIKLKECYTNGKN